jgi:hypothetical protein
VVTVTHKSVKKINTVQDQVLIFSASTGVNNDAKLGILVPIEDILSVRINLLCIFENLVEINASRNYPKSRLTGLGRIMRWNLS